MRHMHRLEDARSLPWPGPLSLKPREAAAALGVSVSTLTRFTKAGKLPCVRLGRNVLYPVAVLQDFLKTHASTAHEGNQGRPC